MSWAHFHLHALPYSHSYAFLHAYAFTCASHAMLIATIVHRRSYILQLIHYVNLNTSIHGVHAYYGTPSIYTQVGGTRTNMCFFTRTRDPPPTHSSVGCSLLPLLSLSPCLPCTLPTMRSLVQPSTQSMYRAQAKLDTVPDWPQRSDDMMPYGG